MRDDLVIGHDQSLENILEGGGMNAIAVFLIFDLAQYFLAVSLEHAGKTKNEGDGTLLVSIRCTYRMGICGGAEGSPSQVPI